MTERQLDKLADVQFNTPSDELEPAISSLNEEELEALKAESRALLNRQMEILRIVAERLC